MLSRGIPKPLYDWLGEKDNKEWTFLRMTQALNLVEQALEVALLASVGYLGFAAWGPRSACLNGEMKRFRCSLWRIHPWGRHFLFIFSFINRLGLFGVSFVESYSDFHWCQRRGKWQYLQPSGSASKVGTLLAGAIGDNFGCHQQKNNQPET